MLRRTVYSAIRYSGLPSVLRRAQPAGLSVFMFHGLTDRAHTGMENASGMHHSVEAFEVLCRVLGEEYNVLPLPDAVDALRRGLTLPSRAVSLTFDDGYFSNLRLALPVLQRCQIPATVYCATEFVNGEAFLWPDRLEYALGHTQRTAFDWNGQTWDPATASGGVIPLLKAMPQEGLPAALADLEHAMDCRLTVQNAPDIYQPMSWSDISRLQQGGLVTVGAHTHRHLIAGRCSEETFRREMEVSLNLFREKAGFAPKHFAYPNGQEGDYNSATRRELKRLGMASALTTIPGINHFLTDNLAMHRFGVPESPDHMDLTTSGAFHFINRVLRRAA